MIDRTNRIRMTPKDRYVSLLEAALRVVSQRGFNVSMSDVAREAGCSRPLVPKYLGGTQDFKKKVIKEAIRTNNLRVIGHGVVARLPACRRLPEELRNRALKSIV